MPQKEMVFLNGKSCAFTGHRPHKLPWKYDETDSRCIMLKKILDHQIEILVNEGVTSFFSGMAEGVDQWAASSVLAQRVKNPTLSLHCILPWKGQEEKWSQAARKHYQEILRQADTVTYMAQEFQKDCLLNRNHCLVDLTAILLAVYKGECRVGTEATIRYAKSVGREIIIIDPLTLDVFHF